jgi:hypothetical protein
VTTLAPASRIGVVTDLAAALRALVDHARRATWLRRSSTRRHTHSASPAAWFEGKASRVIDRRPDQ